MQVSRVTTPTVLLLWWVVKILLTVVSRFNPSQALTNTEHGSLATEIPIFLYGAIGAIHLIAARKRLVIHRRSWFKWYVAYLVWSALTLTWSDDFGLSWRRYVALLLVSVGSIGLGAGYYSNARLRLARHAVIAGLIATAAVIFVSYDGITLEALSNPAWEPAARSYGPVLVFAASYGLLSSLYLNDQSRKRFAYSCAAFIFTLTVLLLKSRSLIVFTILSAALLIALTRNLRRSSAVVAAYGCIGVVLVLIFAQQLRDDLGRTALQFYSRGNNMLTLEELNGRLPLWNYLWTDVQQHFWDGVGFGAYWNVQRMSAAWNAVQWPAVVAHNGFLDEALQTGVFGLGLITAAFGTGMYSVWRIHRGLKSPMAALVLCWLLLFVLLNCFDSLFQSVFNLPFLLCLMSLSALTSTGTRAIHTHDLPQLACRS